MKNYKFTIFTPCYNGANTIHRVFESVLAQSYDNWEWIIVNDGSADNSDSVIKGLLASLPANGARDRIRYISQDNQGKHRTWNMVADMATGDYFVPADCDDSFVPETLAFYNNALNKEVDLSHLSGINVCCYLPDTGELIGTPYPEDGLLSDNIELAYRYHIQGEHWGCIRTDLLRKYKFPEIDGHFYSESYLWFSFPRDGYKLRCYNKCLRAYYQEPDSLIHNRIYKLNRLLVRMSVHFQWWTLTNVGHLIRRYSVKAYLYEWLKLFKSLAKYALVCLRP